MPLPTHDDVAQLLGLDRWCIGAHRTSSQGDRGVYVDALWLVEGEPSFHDKWALAGVLAHDFGPAGDGPSWRRAVLAQGNESALIDLDADPVSDALKRVDLFHSSPYAYLDGIGYSVRVATNALSGQFQFSNPDAPSLIALEAAALELAERATAASGRLLRVVDVWRQYAVRSPPGEPLELRLDE
jgi:hypothetical protein